MKKLLSVFLTICVLLGIMVVPAVAETEDLSEAISGINYYKWDFSEDAIYTDYSKAKPHPQGKTTATSTFDPILNGMDGTEYGYKVEHATVDGKDALRVVYSGSGYKTAMVPLMSDGKAFVMEPGKSYTFMIDVTFKANANTSGTSYYSGTMLGIAAGTNLRSNGWNNEGIASPLGISSKYSYAGVNGFRSIYDMYDLGLAFGSSDIGGTANTTYTYKNGSLTETAYTFNVSETGKNYHYGISAGKGDYIVVPELEFGQYQQVTNAQSSSVYKEDAVGCFQYFGAYKHDTYNPQSTHTFYNQYFALELPACRDVYVKGDLPDAIEKIEVDGETYSHAYADMYITKLAVLESDYAVVELYDGDTRISDVIGKIGETVQLEAPEAVEGKKFLGWYYEKEFTTPVTSLEITAGITEVYARYEELPKTTITLKNGEDIQEISGYPGSSLTLPETGIIDTNWYTDYKNYKIFTESTFPTEDIELHSAKETLDFTNGTMYCSSELFSTSTAENENGESVPTLLFDGTQGKYQGFYRLGKVEEQVTYKLSFSYLPESLNNGFNINLRTASYANFGSFYMYVEGDEADDIYTINDTNSQVGQWNEAEIFFTANLDGELKHDIPGYDFEAITTGFDALFIAMSNDGGERLQMKDFVITPIENALTAGGASFLEGEAEEVAQGQAIRYYFDYKTTDGKKIILDNKEYEIIERGVIFRNADTYAKVHDWGMSKQRTPSSTVAYRDDAALRVFGIGGDELTKCWEYYENTNTLRYSYYVYGFGINDERELMARGFITFKDADGNIFTIYSADRNRSVAYLASAIV